VRQVLPELGIPDPVNSVRPGGDTKKLKKQTEKTESSLGNYCQRVGRDKDLVVINRWG
jgi:hypothetical protein